LKKLVRDAVRGEIIEDCRQHHYTKRMQNQMIAKHEDLLVNRIENSLVLKLKDMHSELEKLKTVKVTNAKKDDLWLVC
jgi:hypothetical protein